MRARRRVMGTRCSARAPVGAAGRAAGARTLAGGRLPRKSTTSDLVSLPSRPEAGIAAGSRRFSSISRRTDGLSLPESRPPSASAAAAPGFAPDAAAAAVAFGAATPPSSMRARTWPLVTTAPLGTRISRTTPLAGAGTSSTTLSVSRSARFSSRRMGSPGCLCHATSVASATDSGSWGTRIDRKSTRLNSSHSQISYAVFCLKKKKFAQTRVDIAAADYVFRAKCSVLVFNGFTREWEWDSKDDEEQELPGVKVEELLNLIEMT